MTAPFAAGYTAAVNSTLRISDSSSTDCNFSYFFNNLPQQQRFNRVTVVDFVVPKSWYLINTGRNTFTLSEDTKSTTVTVPPGNYSQGTWMTILGTLLNNASIAMGHAYNYTVTTPDGSTTGVTYINTITVSNNGGIQPIITIPANTTINEILGLAVNRSYQFSNNVLVPPFVASFQLEWSVYLHSDIHANDGDDILCAIFNTSTGGDGQSVRYQAQHPTLSARRYQPRPSSAYRFWLTDEQTNLMDTHGLNVNFTILFFRVEDPVASLNSSMDDIRDSFRTYSIEHKMILEKLDYLTRLLEDNVNDGYNVIDDSDTVGDRPIGQKSDDVILHPSKDNTIERIEE